jgi:hypothetical protein
VSDLCENERLGEWKTGAMSLVKCAGGRVDISDVMRQVYFSFWLEEKGVPPLLVIKTGRRRRGEPTRAGCIYNGTG